MELQVTLTLSDRLFALLEDKMPNLGRRIENAVVKEIGAQTRRESSISVQISPATPTADAASGETPGTEPEAPGAVPDADTPALPEQPGKELTEVDIREAIHRTRQRFEGEDYKENTDSEAYKRYHKQLNGVFKRIASLLTDGADDKPSRLPANLRAAFIAQCEALTLDENGNIAFPEAPF